jgi:hypothetical protein
MEATHMPEMMTRAEYVTAQKELDRVAGIVDSLHREYELESAHLQHVRNAVYHSRDIHINNWSEYKGIISGLCLYSVNGNIAVFDRHRKPLTDKQRIKQYFGAVEFSDYLERKKEERVGR